MSDAVECILGILALVLCAAAFAVGWQVIREAWRGDPVPRQELSGAPAGVRSRPDADVDARADAFRGRTAGPARDEAH